MSFGILVGESTVFSRYLPTQTPNPRIRASKQDDAETLLDSLLKEGTAWALRCDMSPNPYGKRPPAITVSTPSGELTTLRICSIPIGVGVMGATPCSSHMNNNWEDFKYK